MNRKFDIKIILICILIPLFILLSNFLLLNMRKDNANVTKDKELVFSLAEKSGYEGNYDTWFKDNKDDTIILGLDETKLQWIYSDDISNNKWNILFDMKDNIGLSVFEVWSMLNPEKTEDKFYLLINNSLYIEYDNYVAEHNYEGSYLDWCKELLRGSLVIKKEYTITFDSNGSNSVLPQKIKEGDLISMPSNPVKSGYKFIGWFYNGELWSFNTSTVKSNMTLIAKYELVDYKISYNLNGGYNNDKNITSYNLDSDSFTLLPAVREHYIFTGWYENGSYSNKVDIIDPNNKKDYNLSAGWEAIEYTVSYHIPNEVIKTNIVFNVETDTIDLNIDLDSSYDYDLYLDINYETPYTSNVEELLNYLVNGNVTVYVDITNRDYGDTTEGSIVSFNNHNWKVLVNDGGLCTLKLENVIEYTVTNLNQEIIKDDILNLYSNLLIDIAYYDELRLNTHNSLGHYAKYFDFDTEKYYTHLSDLDSVISCRSTKMQNLILGNTRLYKELELNKTYNIVPIIVVRL